MFRSKTQNDDEEDLLSLLQGEDTEDVEEVPRERVRWVHQKG